jgi:hypothetical protein
MALPIELSRGPQVDTEVEKGVHILFYPTDLPPDPDPNIPVSPSDLAVVSANIGTVQRTDVVIFRGKPWHQVNGELKKHPEVHLDFPDTILSVRAGVEKAVWWSEQPFSITDIVDHAAGTATAPSPFTKPPTRTEIDIDGRATPIYVARSRVPLVAARDHEFKIWLTRNGISIDPNMKCT